MTSYVMHREVCLKHRKNRREIFLRVRTQVPSWQRCLFFFVVCGAGVTTRAAHSRSSFKSRMPECQSGDAGASPAERTIFQIPTTRRAPACAAWSPKPCKPGAAPGRRAISRDRGGARWEGSGLISRLRAGSIPAPATHFPPRSLNPHSEAPVLLFLGNTDLAQCRTLHRPAWTFP